VKKTIVGFAVLGLVLVTMRRFGPSLAKWAVAKCQQTMAKYGVGTEVSDSYATNRPATPAAV
jgi:hypothetical protein